jgi:tetratricopeptide (TPR) repeat protein
MSLIENSKAYSLFLDGNNFLNKNLYHEAKNCYLDALNLSPNRKSILFNLSVAYFKLRDFNNALLNLNKLMRPEFIDSEVVTLFTAVHLKNKTLIEALLALEDYSKKNEFIVEFYYGKALVYYHKNLTEKSIDILEFIIKKNADYYPGYYLLGLNYQKHNNLYKALETFLKCIDYNKKFADAYFSAAQIYKDLGNINLAQEFYDKCYNLDKENTTCLVEKSLILPIIYLDNEELNNFRESYDKNLSKISENKSFDEITVTEFPSNQKFYLSYNNFNNLQIIKKKILTFRKIFKKLNYFNLNLRNKNNSLSKIRIAFISEFLTNHTIGQLFQGIILNLDRKKYDVFLFHSHKTKESSIKNILDISSHKSIQLPEDFDEKIKIIENEKLDIIFYPDIGMSSDLYYLTFLKFAPIQITSWGHPETTGNDSIDYFLSSKLIEIESAQNHYSEKLICLKNMPMFYSKPLINKETKLSDISNLNKYACPQTLFKILPDFDIVIKKILLTDKKSQIYFIKDQHNSWYKILQKRWKKNLIDLNRIHFVDCMPREKFIEFCGNFKVLLDPFYFGAGNSFYESLVYGVPTVTMPNQFMRSRLVTGAYEQMKIENPPVTKNIDDYVETCLDLANNSNLNLKLRNQIIKNSELYLFQNIDTLKEFNLIFENLLKE